MLMVNLECRKLKEISLLLVFRNGNHAGEFSVDSRLEVLASWNEFE